MIPLKGFFFFVVVLQVVGLIFIWWLVDCHSSRNDARVTSYREHVRSNAENMTGPSVAEDMAAASIRAPDQVDASPGACGEQCGGHGRCINRVGATPGHAVCVCMPGRVGRDCADTLQNWYKSAGLNDHAHLTTRTGTVDGSLWNYLNSSAYRMRYAGVGSLLRSHRHILEVGGFLSPIDAFLPEGSAAQSVTVVDPTIEGSATLVGPLLGSVGSMRWRQVLHLPMTLADYQPRGDEDAVMFLGVQKEETFQAVEFEQFLKGSALRTLVLEGAKTKPVQARINRLIDLATQHRFQATVRMTFDFTEMAKELGINMVLSPANVLRRLVVLERGGRMLESWSRQS